MDFTLIVKLISWSLPVNLDFHGVKSNYAIKIDGSENFHAMKLIRVNIFML